MALVRADAGERHDIHTKLDLPNVLTEVEVRAEGPLVLDETEIDSLVVLETSANLDAHIDGVGKEELRWFPSKLDKLPQPDQRFKVALDSPVDSVTGSPMKSI